jgi:hypothetical protein
MVWVLVDIILLVLVIVKDYLVLLIIGLLLVLTFILVVPKVISLHIGTFIA